MLEINCAKTCTELVELGRAQTRVEQTRVQRGGIIEETYPFPKGTTATRPAAAAPLLKLTTQLTRRAPVPESTRLPARVCFLNVSRGSGRREKRRCSCSAASTSAVGWEAPVRTRSIICFGDWRTPESLQAVKLTAQQDRQRNSHRDTAIRSAKRSANTEIPTHD